MPVPEMCDQPSRPLYTRDFSFKFRIDGPEQELQLAVEIPLTQTVPDLAGRLVNAHQLPCFLHQDLEKSLEEFVREETEKYYDERGDKAVRAVQEGDVDVDQLVDRWANIFNQEVKGYVRPMDQFNNDQIFSDVYHQLIHSEALETLLNLEHTYAIAVEDVITQRDRDVQHLQEKQAKEMEEAVGMLGVAYTDQQVNKLAQRQFENTQMIQSKWASELSNLQETQKREYREWVMKVHEDTQTATGTPSYVQRVRALSNIVTEEGEGGEDVVVVPQRMEESFTIHLGAQLKTMHNLRLLCADVLDLCRHKHNRVGGAVIPSPQRLQTAMSLYSNQLCGLVLLVDNRLSSYTGIKREFARVCEQSTDFHFPTLEQQFQRIERDVVTGNEWRVANKAADEAESASVKSAGSGSSQPKEDKSNRMQTGDFYITRHSNLSDVHTVFHLVADETLSSTDISSRHPVIMALRNILKVCFRHDVLTLTLPLLLVHEMNEDMTIQWCTRRAELVLKCVKGFMMEMATWGGQESRTVQFLVPKGCSEKMFVEFCAMLPGIFRMSNPVKG